MINGCTFVEHHFNLLRLFSSNDFYSSIFLQGTILFHSKAQEALQKAREAQGGEDLKVKDQIVHWEVLEGETEMETLKKIIEDQQESLNKRKGGRGTRLIQT